MDPLVLALTERVVRANEKHILSWLGNVGKAAIEAITFNCAGHIEQSFEKCSRVTTLLDRDEASLVKSIYVKTYLEHKNEILDDDALLNLMDKGAAFVIQGKGGSGKSMLMKHLFLDIVASSSSSIPVFVELRGLNDLASKDLIAFTYYSMTGPADATMTLEQFRKGIESSFFTLFLTDSMKLITISISMCRSRF